MSKKLLMNNYSENDRIVLCENYTPTNMPIYLWQNKKIDWDNYELYIDLNIYGNAFSNWTSALVISSIDDIQEWNSTSNSGKIHIYYTWQHIRLQPVSKSACQQADKELMLYNNKKIQITINKNGIYLENRLIMSCQQSHVLHNSLTYLKTSNTVTIGIIQLGGIYNEVSLRKYQERS